eukprot:XP_001702687.1 predicted protein [Chlamydomonas reinhardtii]
MQPNDDEARAALYNLGCALTKQKKFSEAVEAIERAINDYGLKLIVALRDDDLRLLRERREWMDALGRMKGGMSRQTKADLRTEAKVDLGKDRVLPLLKFRGQVRPVIVAGSRSFVEKAIKEAEGQYLNLRDRAVSVVPIIFEKAQAVELDPEDKLRLLKKEFAKEGAKGFGDESAKKAASEPKAKKVSVLGGLVEADKKWRLEAYDTDEWKAWILEQKEFSGLSTTEPNCYIQVQLDGTVRSSGTGSPPWDKLVEELPLLSDFRTRLTDGVGPQE